MLVYRTCLLICTCLSVLTGALRYRSWITSPPPSSSPSSPSPHTGDSSSGSSSSSDGDGQTSEEFFAVPYLTVVPALSAAYPWTLVTSTFVEQNIFTLAITLATLFYGGKYLERAWGSAEFVKFLLVVAAVPNVLASAVYVIWFALSGNVVRSYVGNAWHADEGR